MPITISSVKFGDFVFNHLIHQNPTDRRNYFVKHVHNEFEIILFLSGDATYIIEDKKYKLKPFDLILIPPSRYHYIQIDSDANYDRFDILFPTDAIGESLINKIPNGTDVVSCTEHRIIRDIFGRMDRYSELGEDVITDLLPGMIKEIFL